MGYHVKNKAKKDDNHNAVVDVFRRCGYNVIETYAIDCGFDFFAWAAGKVFVIEVKDGEKPPSQRKLTDNEEGAKRLYDKYYHVLKSVGEAIELVQSKNN